MPSAQVENAARACFGAAKGAGRARTIWRRAIREGRFAPGDGDGLGARAAATWRRHFAFDLPVVQRVEEDGDAAKAVLALPRDGLEVECVRIAMGRARESLCLSIQVGCRMGCRFCETGRMGLLRDLTPDEVVGQVVAARALGWRPDNLVFMGMGEALDAFDTLTASLEVLCDPVGLGFAHDRITVCTVGHAEGIRRLAEFGMRRLGLALSLNSALDDALRARTMPVAAKRWPLAEVQDALRAYRARRRDNLQLGIHWCLMPGINDSEEEVLAIARFCAPLGRVLVHVIPYNPGREPLTRAPSDREVSEFVTRLREHGLRVRRRVTKGRSAMAACGQLGNPDLRRVRNT
jgi:23S rRNA (adenine2503-C2)-methyltransferase